MIDRPNLKAVAAYIIRFLLGECNEALADCISYDTEPHAVVNIVPSKFFDEDFFLTKQSLPSLPLKQVEAIPLLFGDPMICTEKEKIIAHADIIASTFFLITRYEEYVCPDVRDRHGRFIGKESLPYRAGFLDRPIVEEYGKLLRSWLRKAGIPVTEPKPRFSQIYLTHDVDIPWVKFTFWHAVKHCMSRLIKMHKIETYPFTNLLGRVELDPRYTFDDLIQADQTVSGAQSIYFIKSGGQYAPYDAGIYIDTKPFGTLREKLRNSGATLGYHVSYEAGMKPEMISAEVKKLRKILSNDVRCSRNHYLASREPADLYQLLQNGIADDFTMAYADAAGFRLGTCRAVNWIDPVTMQITELRLHPLTIMDCTLTGKSYMGLNEEESHAYGEHLIMQTYMYGGEIDLLWHNSDGCGDENNLDWRNYLHFINYLSKISSERESESNYEESNIREN